MIESLAGIITIILGIFEIVVMIIAIGTCKRVNTYIDLKMEEAYKKEIYEKARQDINDIKEQLK